MDSIESITASSAKRQKGKKHWPVEDAAHKSRKYAQFMAVELDSQGLDPSSAATRDYARIALVRVKVRSILLAYDTSAH
jgi:hypothetical protein